ncbi:unknown [Ruminococcus sp. CAG:382]|nr:unknown [Ruminococcus sp. CAG:382]
MLISSMTTAFTPSGSSAFFEKTGFASSLYVISSRRWIVFASLPDASLIRFAALPVGAARAYEMPIISKMSSIAFITVVLPVPGPPVTMLTPKQTALRMAFFCFS